jgi:ribosomal protein RSM22 (predicted rRNA methylase)
MHRLTKNADVPWEDEKFIYLAASRQPTGIRAARILAPPQVRKGRIGLKLCHQDGRASEDIFSRRDGEVFKRVRRQGWGDILPL